MPERGTYTFTDPDEFEAGIRGARFDLVLTRPGDFKARLTCVELRTLHLLRGGEELPRIAHVSLAPEPAFVTFPIQADPPPIWSGIELRLGDIVFHSRDGTPCRSPAMSNGRCRMHGGKSTGPRTPEGLERSRKARWQHGHCTAAAKTARAEARASMRLLRWLLAQLPE